MHSHNYPFLQIKISNYCHLHPFTFSFHRIPVESINNFFFHFSVNVYIILLNKILTENWTSLIWVFTIRFHNFLSPNIVVDIFTI